jgi:hypothetical protein
MVLLRFIDQFLDLLLFSIKNIRAKKGEDEC